MLMSLLEDDFDIDYDIGNYDGVDFGDIFYLNYYGINVFFYVCGLDHHQVRIYELAKKRSTINGVHAEYLTPDLKPTRSPKVVLEHNSWTKSEFWVKTDSQGNLIIPLGSNSPLVKEAYKLGVYLPASEYAYAFSLKEQQKEGILKYYWEAPKKKIEKKQIFFN